MSTTRHRPGWVQTAAGLSPNLQGAEMGPRGHSLSGAEFALLFADRREVPLPLVTQVTSS